MLTFSVRLPYFPLGVQLEHWEVSSHLWSWKSGKKL